MLGNVIKKLVPLDRENRIIVFSTRAIEEKTGLRSLLASAGFTVFDYENVESFRIVYEERIKPDTEKTAVIVSTPIFVPYDIRRSFFEVNISLNTLFPNLNPDVAAKYMQDWDIISYAVELSYTDYRQAHQTERFIYDTVFNSEMIGWYCQAAIDALRAACETALSYKDWIQIANSKAAIEYYAAMKNIKVDLLFADESFTKFISDGYSRLSTEVGSDVPPIITKSLSTITANGNEKVALVVMDGMSLFDFKAISRHFSGIDYDFGSSYALIPTMTPVSRQSLLSGKYPRELSKPFSPVDEEKEFTGKAVSLGYAPAQVEYLRGFDANVSPLSRLIAIIINEVDDIVHGQRQGRAGMYNDIDLLGKSGKLQTLISRLTLLGFTVYITADHGNTLCTGVGGFRSGLEIESRSKRMAVLKDFAQANALLSENAVEYQGFYLDREYRYFVCKNGVSFDNKGETVMTHGGMSLDEVVVPFVRVRGVSLNV